MQDATQLLEIALQLAIEFFLILMPVMIGVRGVTNVTTTNPIKITLIPMLSAMPIVWLEHIMELVQLMVGILIGLQ